MLPAFATFNSGFGMWVAGLVALALWYSNAWHTGSMPINSNRVWDHFGKRYNATRVLDERGHFDLAKYEKYSAAYMGATQVLVYGLFFACYSSVVTHVALYQRHELKLGFKNFWSAFNPFKWTSKTNEGATQRTEDGAYTDVHNRLMSVYNEGIIPCSIQKAFWLLMYCSPTLVVFHYYGSGDRRRRYWPDCVSNVYHASGTPIWPFALSIVRRACWHT